jgi:aspartate racemase
MEKTRPFPLRTIGILGGMSDQATAEYYRLINHAVNQRLGGWDIAETVIVGVNFGNIEHYIRHELWTEAGDYLSEKAQRAERAGADLLLCASNTMHCVSDRITEKIKIPFLHIADPTGEAIRRADLARNGLTKIALLGTKPTMSMTCLRDYYQEKHGLQIVVPNETDQQRLHQIIFDELVRGLARPESKAFYLEVCERLRQQGARGLILGCTEIFLLLSQQDMPDFPMFNTTALHVEAAVEAGLKP